MFSPGGLVWTNDNTWRGAARKSFVRLMISKILVWLDSPQVRSFTHTDSCWNYYTSFVLHFFDYPGSQGNVMTSRCAMKVKEKSYTHASVDFFSPFSTRKPNLPSNRTETGSGPIKFFIFFGSVDTKKVPRTFFFLVSSIPFFRLPE